jgi:general stress protein YciG
VFWSVAFEIVDEEAKRELEKRGGVKEEDKKVLQDAGKVGNEEMPQATEENDDDVD